MDRAKGDKHSKKLFRIELLFRLWLTYEKIVQISQGTRLHFESPLRSLLLRSALEGALHAPFQLLYGEVSMSPGVVPRVFNRVIHEVVSSIVIVQIGPGVQEGVRPSCFSSGRQLLIRSEVPGREGPTPRQLLPYATFWGHEEITVYSKVAKSQTGVKIYPSCRKNLSRDAPNARRKCLYSSNGTRPRKGFSRVEKVTHFRQRQPRV